jgi:menaquinone-9 beta-reductase
MPPTPENRPVIIGAGPGGAATALFLAKSGIPSLLIDRSTFPRDKICGDALSGKVWGVLRRYDRDWSNSFQVETIQIPSWGIRFIAPGFQHVDIPFKKQYNTQNDPPPGHIATRYDFDNWLLGQCKAHPLIEVQEGIHIQRIEPAANGYQLIANTDQSIFSPIIVGADGANSIVARQLANQRIDSAHYAAGLRQYFSNVANPAPDNYIELFFLRELLPGYFWIFPLPNGQFNVGLGLRRDIAKKRGEPLTLVFNRIIQEHPILSKRFQSATALEPIRGFGLPLGSRRLSISGNRFLLVGDAASLIDPFTGEGIGNALESGYLAAQTIVAAITQDRYDSKFLIQYDKSVYKLLGQELKLSSWLQRLARYPALFNWVIAKANRHPELQDQFIAMFENTLERRIFMRPSFYWRLLTQ